tara:strand:+ start:51 stop:701 length:651 start_codon:yes stop_codon:yes gene_type:complete
MSIKKYITQVFFKNGYILEEAVNTDFINRFLKRFREHYVSLDLIRIGGERDGGYLVPDILSNVSHCFSPGVDDIADFESHLSREYGIKSFMADASVESAPLSDEDFFFIKKFLGTHNEDDFITLKSWMDSSLEGDEKDLILQMDIEGAEYDVLTIESAETLNRFSFMIIEFHSLNKMFDRYFLQMITSVFEKIYRNFSICHVHPNNCCGVSSLNGV